MNFVKSSILQTLLILSLVINVGESKTQGRSEVISSNDVDWGYLNPARGDKGPQAADLWGDRTIDTSSGILLRFPSGFSSPPHIHNITYRGVVISGELHNDDPGAEKMWLPAGSFWTQPAGESHITAANGKSNMAFIEIESGPYLVQPTTKAFDNGERPINVDKSNIVWSSAPEDISDKNLDIKIAYLWGDATKGNVRGSMLKLPAGFSGKITSNDNSFKAVVIEGDIIYQHNQRPKELDAGSYFGSTGKFDHIISLNKQQESTLYVRSTGKYRVVSD